MKFALGFAGFIYLLAYLAPDSYVNKNGVVVHKPKYEIRHKEATNG